MIQIIIRVIRTITNPIFTLIFFFSRRKSIPKATNPILTCSATELARKIRDREVTCEEVITIYINRCREVNSVVNAIIQDRFNNAIKDARNIDDFLRSTSMTVTQLEKEKPLLGIPITIKECCSVKGMILSLGLKRYAKLRAGSNSDAVQLLLNAGAIPIAITSTPPYSEWIDTFNSVIGYTSNPYDTRRSCGGSSGGEGALLASAGSILGLGSDFGGSIRIPSAFCGTFGHKPSTGMVSNKGILTFTSNREKLNMLTTGPLCRYAIDLELAMKVLSKGKFQQNIVQLQEIKIYYLLEYENNILDVNPTIKIKIMKAVEFFSNQYHCHVEQMNLPEFKNILEMTLSHHLYLESMPEEINEAALRYKRKKFHHVLLEVLIKLSLLKDRNIKFYNDKKPDLQTNLLNLLAINGVLLMPTWPNSAFYRYQGICELSNVCHTYFVNALGLPSTAIPIGFDNSNMPLSIQAIAGPNNDHLCTAVAKHLEKLYGGWTPPY